MIPCPPAPRALARTLFIGTLALFSVAPCAGGPAPRPVDAARLVAADAEPGNWMSHGRDYAEQRFSPLGFINAGNVAQLGLAWSFKYDLDRVVEATPLVVDGVLYTTAAYSMVYALDAASGGLLWKYDPQVARAVQARGCCDAANRGVAAWGDKVYVGVYDGRLEALDAKTGRKIWSVDTVIDPQRNYTITGAPRIVKGKVIIGNGGAEFGVRGYVSAYDAETGKLAWRFFTVPGDPALGDETPTITMIRKTWFGDQYWKQGGGGTAWDSMAYDAELDLLYIGIGNGSFWNYGARSEGRGDNLFLSSIVAVRPDSGAYVWHYQTTPGDAWDYTATQSIILATLPIAGKPTKVVMQAPKNGFFYVLDAASGKLISAEKYGAMVTWAKGVDPHSGRPILDREAADYWSHGEAKTVFPGSQGAHNWHPMSFNPQTGLVYIPEHTTAERYSPQQRIKPPRLGTPNLGMEMPSVPETAGEIAEVAKLLTGKLQAWNPVTQKEVWSAPYPIMSNGGTLTSAGNLVFQGTADGRLIAYAADSGAKLWEQTVSSGVVAGPISYRVGGEQYVAFNVGWGGAFPIAFGAIAQLPRLVPDSRLFVFKLGGTQPMPAVQRRPGTPPAPPPLAADPATLAGGKELFNAHCGICHGIGAMSANVIPDLRYLSEEKHVRFAAIVYGLREAAGMPNFAGKLDPGEVEAVRQYIISRSQVLRDELTPKAAR